MTYLILSMLEIVFTDSKTKILCNYLIKKSILNVLKIQKIAKQIIFSSNLFFPQI